MKNILYIGLCLLLCCTSCMEDLGNYDYSEVNEITIEGIEELYTVYQAHAPMIAPDKIKQTKFENEDNLEYFWLLNTTSGWDTLCQSRTCDKIILYATGRYSVKFIARDKESGLFATAKTSFDVQGVVGEGLVVLSKKSNNEASLSYFPSTQDIEPTIDFFPEIGYNPVKVNFHSKGKDTDSYLSVMCDDGKGGVILDPIDFVKVMDYQDFFWDNAHPKPMGYTASHYNYKSMSAYAPSYMGNFYYEHICDNGKIYERYNFSVAPGNQKFGVALLAPDDKGYEASPCLMPNMAKFMICYDRKNRRFLRANGDFYANLYLITLASGSDTSIFNPNDMGENMELLFGDIGPNSSGGQYYTVFTNGIQNYFIHFIMNFSGQMTPVAKVDITDVMPIEANTKIAVHNYMPNFYFSKGGNTLWRYDVNAKMAVPLFDEFEEGEEITCLYFEPQVLNNNGKYTFGNGRLYVGVKKTTSEGIVGSVYVLEILPNNESTLIEKYSNILGEIVSMVWKR